MRQLERPNPSLTARSWADEVGGIHWYRAGFRLFWKWKSRPRRGGRRPVDGELVNLIRQMSRVNPLWGAPRIHGELRKLGLGVAQRTVAEYMLPGSRRPSSQTWTTSRRNYLGHVVSVEFFTVPTFNFRLLYVFLVRSHQRRQVLHLNVVAERPRLAVHMLVQALKPESARGTILDGALQVPAVQKWATKVTNNRAPSTAVQGQTPARAFERTLWQWDCEDGMVAPSSGVFYEDVAGFAAGRRRSGERSRNGSVSRFALQQVPEAPHPLAGKPREAQRREIQHEGSVHSSREPSARGRSHSWRPGRLRSGAGGHHGLLRYLANQPVRRFG